MDLPLRADSGTTRTICKITICKDRLTGDIPPHDDDAIFISVSAEEAPD